MVKLGSKSRQSSSAINFAALERPLGLNPVWGRLCLIGLGLLLGSFISDVALGSSPKSGLALVVFAITLYGAILALIVGFIGYVYRKNQLKNAAFEQFLLDNSWTPRFSHTFDDLATVLLGIGDSQYITKEFTGNYKNHEFIASAYQYSTGSGKSRQTHYFINLFFKLQQQFPLILLDDISNNPIFGSDLPSHISGTKTLQLEGNFNDRFQLRVLPGTERSVLQLLTPDFMQELMDNKVAANIELEADKLFLVCGGSSFTAQNLRQLFSTADIVLKNIAEVSDTWQASSSKESVILMADKALSPRKQILKPKQVKQISVVAIIIYIIIMLLQGFLAR